MDGLLLGGGDQGRREDGAGGRGVLRLRRSRPRRLAHAGGRLGEGMVVREEEDGTGGRSVRSARSCLRSWSCLRPDG